MHRKRYSFPSESKEEKVEPVDAKQYMADLADELHKPVRHKFPTRKVFADGIDTVWGIDLAEMGHWKAENDGYAYILLAIDVFTRWGAARALKTKTGKEVTAAMRDIVAESKRKPRKIWADEGKEWLNKTFKDWLTENGIILFHTYGPGKSVIAERFVKVVKDVMWPALTRENTHEWVAMLPKIIADYNNKYHSVMKMSPNEASANPAAVAKVWDALRLKHKRDAIALYKVGDVVRVSRTKGVFEKGYDVSWSRELFTIVSVDTSRFPTVYHLKDMRGEPIHGSFYTQELQKTKHGDVDLIEEVLGEKGKGKNKMLFVKWLGYPKSFNSWIAASSTVKT